jgi:hypothetical protein
MPKRGTAEPIVVGGCHRSGTSLVRRILDAHSQIYCGPEVKLLLELSGRLPDDPAPHLRFISSARSIATDDDLYELLLPVLCELHARAAARRGKPRWADKNPENVLHLQRWQDTLGERMTFVHVVRNPLDTLASMQEANFPHTLPKALAERIARYETWTQRGLDHADAHPDRTHRLLYEELVSEPRDSIAALMEAVGAEFEEGQLDFNAVRHDRGLEDPGVAATTQVHADSLGRWRDVLSSRDANTIRRRTRDVWRRIDPDERWLG